MTSFATVELKRCPGWRHAGYEGHAAHTLPATLEYFHRSLTKHDGLNPQCKVCTRGYQLRARTVWNSQRAFRKAANEAKVAL
jgi:hypothetical protein